MSDNKQKNDILNIPELYCRQEMFPIRNFPLTAMLVPHPCQYLSEHRHEFIELVLIFRGRGCHLAKDHEGNVKEFPISAGDVFVIGQGVLHSFFNCENLWVYNLLFIPELLSGEKSYLAALPIINRMLSTSGAPSAPLHLSGNILYHVIEQLNRIIHETREQQEGFELVAKIALLEILQLLGRRSTEADSICSRHHEAIHRAFDYMEAHFDKPMTLAVLAREACMSKSHFCRKFKAVTSLTPWECLIQLRLEKVKELLLSTDQSTEEIALRTGLCDSSYLAKMFKKQEHMTPKQFRIHWTGI